MTEVTPEGPDEIEDEDFEVLDSLMPAEAARILRRVMRKARNAGASAQDIQTALQGLNTARQSQAERIATLEGQMASGIAAIAALQAADISHDTALGQLNTARQNHAQRLTSVENRVTAIGG